MNLGEFGFVVQFQVQSLLDLKFNNFYEWMEYVNDIKYMEDFFITYSEDFLV